MSKSKRIILLSAGLMFILVAAGQAQMRRLGAGIYPGLGLTDEQMEKIQEIQLAFQEEFLPLRIKQQKVQLSLNALMRKGADQNQIDARIKALNEAEMDIDKKFLDHQAQIRSLLAEEQVPFFNQSWGPGLGQKWMFRPRWGMNSGAGMGYGLGWGPGMRRGLRSGWGSGLGRGYYCPLYR